MILYLLVDAPYAAYAMVPNLSRAFSRRVLLEHVP